jgi:hypothetical protein
MNLADPYLKTTRAKVHLESLQHEVNAFYKSKPWKFHFEDDVENQLHFIRLEIANTPDEINLIAGDLFFNLRAALDQLVWYLAKSKSGPSYPEMTQFPILEERTAKTVASFRKYTRGVPAEAVSIIESLQPYHARDTSRIHSHHLWRLNKLHIIDKHRRIPIYGSAGVVTVDMPQAFFGRFVFDENNVMRMPISLKGKVGLNPRLPEFKVVFGDSKEGVACELNDIGAIYEFVSNDVIPRFTRFF